MYNGRIKERKSLGTQGIPDFSNIHTGVAYIAIPEDVERSVFIRNSFNARTLYIRSESGDRWKNVFASDEVFRNVKFPETSDKKGSMVAWIKVPKHNLPLIVGVIDLKDTASIITEEGQVRFQKRTSEGLVDFNMRAGIPEITMDVVSSVNGKGKLRLNVTNPNDTALLDVFVKGETELFATKKFTAKSNEEVRLDVVDELNNVLGSFSYEKIVGWILLDEFANKIETKAAGIFFNDGLNKGLVKLVNTVQKINQLENSLNSLIATFNSHIHVTTATIGGGPALGVIAPTTPSSTATIAPITIEADLENPDVKH